MTTARHSAPPAAHRPDTPRTPPARWYDADEMRWAARRWAARIGVPLLSVHMRPMARKWASISTAGRLTLDASLVGIPRDLGEFVIVHELVHLLCPDARHGRVFKSFLLAYLPDWEERERDLDAISAGTGVQKQLRSRPSSTKRKEPVRGGT